MVRNRDKLFVKHRRPLRYQLDTANVKSFIFELFVRRLYNPGHVKVPWYLKVDELKFGFFFVLDIIIEKEKYL